MDQRYLDNQRLITTFEELQPLQQHSNQHLNHNQLHNQHNIQHNIQQQQQYHHHHHHRQQHPLHQQFQYQHHGNNRQQHQFHQQNSIEIDSDETCFIKLFLEHFNSSIPFLTREILDRGKESNLQHFLQDDGINIENSDIAASFSVKWSICAVGAFMKCDSRTLMYLDYARFFLQYCFDTPCILSTIAMFAFEYASFIATLRDPNTDNIVHIQKNNLYRMKKGLYYGLGMKLIEGYNLTNALLDLNVIYLQKILHLKYALYDTNIEKLNEAIEACEDCYAGNFPQNLKIPLYSYICYSKWCLFTCSMRLNSNLNDDTNLTSFEFNHSDLLKIDELHLDLLISIDEKGTEIDSTDSYSFSSSKDYSSTLILLASIAKHHVHMNNILESKHFSRNIARSVIERNILICTPLLWDICYFAAAVLHHAFTNNCSDDDETEKIDIMYDGIYCNQLGFYLFQTCHLCEPLRGSGWRKLYGQYKRNAMEYFASQTDATTLNDLIKTVNWAIILDLRLEEYL